MAIFKVIHEDGSNTIKYETEDDLRRLLHYVCGNSVYYEVNYLYPCNIDGLVNQMLYRQKCRGGRLNSRALHFVLSYDTMGWEKEMDIHKTIASIRILQGLALQFGLQNYQSVFAVHDSDNLENGRHIHIVMNPVHFETGKILHYNKWEFHEFLKDLSRDLYMLYRLALDGVSYINEQGALILEPKKAFLYENRVYPWDGLDSVLKA